MRHIPDIYCIFSYDHSFFAGQQNATVADEGPWHVYHLSFDEFILLIFGVLVRSLCRAMETIDTRVSGKEILNK